jgi:diguanylate cyclase (GGDEF)-like protein
MNILFIDLKNFNEEILPEHNIKKVDHLQNEDEYEIILYNVNDLNETDYNNLKKIKQIHNSTIILLYNNEQSLILNNLLKIINNIEIHGIATIDTLSQVLETSHLKFKETNELKNISYYDHLTNLPNRKYLDENLKRLINISDRYNKKFSVVFIDVDKFKEINDIHGHKKGDEALIDVANNIKASIRTTDFAVRYGGDEFIIVVETDDNDEITGLITRIKNKLQEKNIEISVGYSIYGVDSKNIKEIFELADKNMYIEKRKRR